MKLAEISDGELSIRIRDLRREQLRRAGGMRTCLDCMKPFTARRGARYCSGACRVRACRLRTKQRTKQTGEKLSVVTKTAAPTPLSIKVQGRSAAASPLRYPGGKSALAGFFADIIKQLRLRSTTYVEPYAGGAGAGIVLLQRGLVRKVVINDIDPAVYCFWKSVTEQPDRFASQVVDATLDVDEWRRQQAIYRQADETDPLALGFAFFYLNRTNRSGILNAGPIGGVNQNGTYKIDARYNRDQLAERITSIGGLADRISVSSVDGMSVIRKHIEKKSSFIYIDPPYVDMGGSLYLNAFTHRDHADLASLLGKGRGGNWVLTYDPSDFIRRLYRSHIVRDYQLNYSAHKPGKAGELLIASRPVSNILDGR